VVGFLRRGRQPLVIGEEDIPEYMREALMQRLKEHNERRQGGAAMGEYSSNCKCMTVGTKQIESACGVLFSELTY